MAMPTCTAQEPLHERLKSWSTLEKVSIRNTMGVESLKAGDTTTVDVVAQLKEMW